MKYIKTALALALSLGALNATAAPLTASNLTTGWVDVDSANTYFLSGEYVANNNFFVGGGYAWGDTDGYGDINVFNVNMGAYLPIATTRDRGETYGKVGVGFSDISTDYVDFTTITATAAIFWENPSWRLGASVTAEASDIFDGIGVTSYNVGAVAAYKFDEGRWEAGITGAAGDLDTYGLQVRYNFL